MSWWAQSQSGLSGPLQAECVRQRQPYETPLGHGGGLVRRCHTYLTRDTHSRTGTCCTYVFNSVFHLHENWQCVCL